MGGGRAGLGVGCSRYRKMSQIFTLWTNPGVVVGDGWETRYRNVSHTPTLRGHRFGQVEKALVFV